MNRDLKPNNFLVAKTDATGKRRVKLADFGLAKEVKNSLSANDTVDRGHRWYRSPEKLRAENYGKRSDVWSLGCILYELCTREHPFNGKSCPKNEYKQYENLLNGVYTRCLNSSTQRRYRKSSERVFRNLHTIVRLSLAC